MRDQRTTPSARRRVPVVPLEAGASPANPPCPACGEPLFGWIDARAGLAGPVSRCESCGLGVGGEPGDTSAALLLLDGGEREGTMRIGNRACHHAYIGCA